MIGLICGVKINNKIKYDFFYCVDFSLLKKKNGNDYIRLKLLNSKGIFESYLWDNLHVFKPRIKKKSIYAVKANYQTYNSKTILKIDNINKVNGNRYNKYGYTNDTVKIDSKTKNEFFFNEIIDIIKRYNSSSIKNIVRLYKSNERYFIRGKSLEKRLNVLNYILVSEGVSFNEDRTEEYIQAALLFSINKNILKKHFSTETFDNAIRMYTDSDKEFIKKYKFIVDLMTLQNNNNT